MIKRLGMLQYYICCVFGDELGIVNTRVRYIISSLHYYLCSVFDDEAGIVNKRVMVIIGSGRYSSTYFAYLIMKLTLLTKGSG